MHIKKIVLLETFVSHYRWFWFHIVLPHYFLNIDHCSFHFEFIHWIILRKTYMPLFWPKLWNKRELVKNYQQQTAVVGHCAYWCANLICVEKPQRFYQKIVRKLSVMDFLLILTQSRKKCYESHVNCIRIFCVLILIFRNLWEEWCWQKDKIRILSETFDRNTFLHYFIFARFLPVVSELHCDGNRSGDVITVSLTKSP